MMTNRASSTNPRSKLSAFRHWVKSLFPTLSEWKEHRAAFAWALLSMVLIRLCHQPIGWAVLAPFALAPLFWGMRRCPPKMAFFVGWWFGALHSYMWIGWLLVVARFNPFIYLGILPACLYMGLYAAVTVMLISMIARRFSPWAALPLAGLAWAGMDFWHSIGRMALPYALVGQSTLDFTWLAQGASIGGIYLMTFVMVTGGLTTMEIIAAFKARYGQAEAGARFAVYTGFVVLLLIFGAFRASAIRSAEEQGSVVELALVQTGIDQMVKYESYTNPDQARRLELADQMFVSMLDQLDELESGAYDLIVTPESTLTHEFADAEESIQETMLGGVPMLEVAFRATELGAPIMVGGVDTLYMGEDNVPTELLGEGLRSDLTLRPGYTIYGGLWLIRPEDESVKLRADYRKVRLMPFGEEVPYLSIIPGFQELIVQIGTFGKGVLDEPLSIAIDDNLSETPEVARFGATICFEDQFPYIHRHYAARGAQFFVNSTNDAWFDGSSGQRWHMISARWRSVETGLPMVRATNSGLTVAINGVGEVVESIPPLEKSMMAVDLKIQEEPSKSFYTRLGDWFGWMSMLVMFGLIAYFISTKKKNDNTK